MSAAAAKEDRGTMEQVLQTSLLENIRLKKDLEAMGSELEGLRGGGGDDEPEKGDAEEQECDEDFGRKDVCAVGSRAPAGVSLGKTL